MKKEWFHVFAGGLSLITGLMFYVFVRGYVISPAFPYQTAKLLPQGIIAGSFPSFIHSFAFMLLSVGLGAQKSKAAALWILLNFSLEFAEKIFSLGTFDVFDLLAVVLGVSAAAFCSATKLQNIPKRRFEIPLLSLGALCNTASYSLPPTACPIAFTSSSAVPRASDLSWAARPMHVPVYLSYSDLRAAFAVGEPRPLRESGKILVMDKLLLVSEPNIGVHVYDNSDPAAPKPKYFLNIPGNVDLAAKDGIVYADSFVDLLAIRMNDAKPELVKRVNGTFPWKPYQAIKNNRIRFSDANLDAAKGVVVGYETSPEENPASSDSERSKVSERTERASTKDHADHSSCESDTSAERTSK